MRREIVKRAKRKDSLANRVIALIEAARQKVAAVANVAQVYTNYEIGRQIVEEEQGGKRRAEYGKQLLIDLSQKLTARFGRGWGPRNLRSMRQFYLMYSPVESLEGDLANGFCQIDGGKDLATISRQIPQITLGCLPLPRPSRLPAAAERAPTHDHQAQNPDCGHGHIPRRADGDGVGARAPTCVGCVGRDPDQGQVRKASWRLMA